MSDYDLQPLVGSYPEASPPYPSASPPKVPPPYSSAPPPAQPPPTTTTTVVTQPVTVWQGKLGEFPVQVTCPTGGHVVTTNVAYKKGQLTFVAAGFLCFLLGPLAAIVPFFIDSLKDVEHTCPIDGTVIGVYKRVVV